MIRIATVFIESIPNWRCFRTGTTPNSDSSELAQFQTDSALGSCRVRMDVICGDESCVPPNGHTRSELDALIV